ncbi:MAG: transcription factor RcaD [Coleofasciculaceae cyanobacterium]
METKELKFLLKLLGCPGYRSLLSDKAFGTFTGKDKICRDLGDRGLVDFSREIASVKILPPGNALLKLEKDQLPLSRKEMKLLEIISKATGKITPSKIGTSLKAPERDAILQSFHERGLIEVETKLKRQKAEVWLTERGKEYLLEDYVPKAGVGPAISLDMLTNYLRFLRKNLRSSGKDVSTQMQTSTTAEVTSQPTDEEILQIIRNLDQELGTENYLPIFHLREKLQPPLSREQLDQALYRLEKSDQIELSSLVEAIHYTPAQINAGIPQDIGGPLFFIVVN